MINLELARYGFGISSTLGRLYVNEDGERRFLCFTLEDERRTTKVKHKTCISPGSFEIKLRPEGGMHQRYAERFPDTHQGMLHLQDVPEFTWIYLHTGFKHTHTSGCILVGDIPVILPSGEFELVGSSSEPAYLKLYDKVVTALTDEERVFIHVMDLTKAWEEAA